MAISTDRNTQYGGSLVNQKYSPLRGPTLVSDDRDVYSGLLKNRMTMLRAAGLIGGSLELTMPSWTAAITSEAGTGAATRRPPLVVVSSGRSTWIRAGIDNGAQRLVQLGRTAFDNVSDLRALSGDFAVSPPLYAPYRLGPSPDRNVYVVVNIAEYTAYKKALAGTGITPVGWSFAKGGGARRDLAMVGFGASRFAAMEFCKTLRRQATAPWSAAWLLDDNTVALGSFAGFRAVEDALGANVCAGFRGATNADPRAGTRSWLADEIDAHRDTQATGLPAVSTSGLIQQVALWKISYFDDNRLNFGPLFITSAEDTSMVSYFGRAEIAYQYYAGIGVVKENATQDRSGGVQKVQTWRADLTRWITDAESASPPTGTPPPPIRVLPTGSGDGGEQTLSSFIVNRVLPNAQADVRSTAADSSTQARAKSQGVEQLTNLALRAGYVNADAISATFKINGTAQQVVERRDVA